MEAINRGTAISQGNTISHKDQAFEINKLSIIKPAIRRPYFFFAAGRNA